jgi:hypothetical protein
MFEVVKSDKEVRHSFILEISNYSNSFTNKVFKSSVLKNRQVLVYLKNRIKTKTAFLKYSSIMFILGNWLFKKRQN